MRIYKTEAKIMKNMKNMKSYLKPMGGLALGAVAFTGLLCQPAQAVLIEAGASLLPSFHPTLIAPAQTLTVDWSVTLVGGVYTYSYQIMNPITDNDTVDILNVNANQAYVTSAHGGVGTPVIDASGVTWSLSASSGANAPVPPGGTSPVLTYTSPDGPVLGTAGAQDSSPPSPWGTLAPGGNPVPVPGITVPDGGLTVALLGGSLIALQAFNRRKVQS
jgi:hypothetical protein